jgi:asparagine synthase (glutamine-hydrolysing)
MCGILAIIGKGKDEEQVQELSKRMSHRGPDESDLHVTENGHILSHERLSIIDLNTGKQPIQGTSSAWMVHNGEIYNHQKLRDGILKDHTFRTTSDSEVIVHLYEKFGYDFCDMLDGMFAFVVVDGDDYIAGRDPLGIKTILLRFR